MTIKTITIMGRPTSMISLRRTNGRLTDPQKSVKEDIYWSIREQIDHPTPTLPVDGPIALDLTFFMAIPRSYPVERKEAMLGRPHTAKPDLENFIQFYIDVCNGLLYDDDSQIYKIEAAKIYTNNPRTEIVIRAKESHGTT